MRTRNLPDPEAVGHEPGVGEVGGPGRLGRGLLHAAQRPHVCWLAQDTAGSRQCVREAAGTTCG